MKYLREAVAYGKETITRDVKDPAELKELGVRKENFLEFLADNTIQDIFRLTFAGKR